MSYDEKLAERVRRELENQKAVAEIRMFGGLCFTLRGHMVAGVLKDELMVRLPKEDDEEILKEPYVRPMDFTGRRMRGLYFVRPAGLRTRPALRKWVNRCASCVAGLPPKA